MKTAEMTNSKPKKMKKKKKKDERKTKCLAKDESLEGVNFT